VKLNVRVAGDRSLTGVSLLAVLLVGAAGMALHLGVKTEIAGSSAKPTQSAWTGSRPADSRTRTDPKITLAQSPIRFEENRGQTDPRVKYVARGSGYTLFLTQNEAVLSLQSSATRSKRADEGSAGASQRSVSSAVLRMALLGTSKAIRIQGSEELPSRSNYLVGNDSSRWRRDVPQFARVRYQQVYPGVDLVYYGNQGRLEYDFEVAPGADARQIALQI
jgi:hypothetical protein